MTLHTILAQAGSSADGDAAVAAGAVGLGFACCFALFELAILAAIIAGFWKVFSKAGQPGWAAIIPFYNVYVLCKVAGRPGWWLILFIIPIVSFIAFILVCIDIAKAFGKGGGFTAGLILLPMIFYPILGFGSAQYQGSPHPDA